MIKVAIITWLRWFNQGTLLQAYALQQVICNMGYDCVTLSDRFIDDSQPKPYWSRKKEEVKMRLSRLLYKKYHETQDRGNALCQRFIDDNIAVHEVKAENELASLDNTFDLYVCGSDQIWNPLSEPYYFAPFASKRKISYAPSIGRTEMTNDEKVILGNRVVGFSHLSVREKTGQTILHEVTLRDDVKVVVDPTLLIPGYKWRETFLDRQKLDKGYVFVYFLTVNMEYLMYARKIANEQGKKLVAMYNYKEYGQWADELIPCSPTEFLQHIDSASLVITDSFHGTVFSLLLETPFVTVKRFKDEDQQNQNTRISNLFEMIQQNNIFYDENSLDKAVPFEEFNSAKKSLAHYIDMSYSYLKSALENIPS